MDDITNTNFRHEITEHSKKHPMLTTRAEYKPFEYPQFFEYYKLQQQAHWLPTEVPMADDLKDFNGKLTEDEKKLIINVLRFFTQGDIEVGNNYNTNLVSAFGKPEITMMLTAFANSETVHVWSYSQLNDTLGLPDSDYGMFRNINAMKAKYDYLNNLTFDISKPTDLAKNMAIFGGFIEGVALFSSFAILMNLPRRGLLKNVGQIISWSVKDEMLHSDGVSALFREFVQGSTIHKQIEPDILKACNDVVELEFAFIDTCFANATIDGLTKEEVKRYVCFRADDRLVNLGYNKLYNIENPLPWINMMMFGKEHANFFETRATEYAKGNIIDDWE